MADHVVIGRFWFVVKLWEFKTHECLNVLFLVAL